ncbi:MAG: acetoacetate decarboxylase family protein [Cyanobacteria bacterium Co-bin8]|nr:acetoacetate decarboxylase family protein [Cyanobacteria bacterium Co-bin8]
MTYPPAPWNLNGSALATFHLVDVERVRPLIPAELSIVSVFPGKTLGIVYFSTYTRGSVLEYNELIVLPALLTYKGKVGPWVSHIYVDNADSVEGGREIWGLPKQLAEFTWSDAAVKVYQEGRDLCSLSFQSTWMQLPAELQPSLMGLVFTQVGSALTWFDAQVQTQPAVINGHLTVPASSPFKALDLSQPFLSVSAMDLKVKIQSPV